MEALTTTITLPQLVEKMRTVIEFSAHDSEIRDLQLHAIKWLVGQRMYDAAMEELSKNTK